MCCLNDLAASRPPHMENSSQDYSSFGFLGLILTQSKISFEKRVHFHFIVTVNINCYVLTPWGCLCCASSLEPMTCNGWSVRSLLTVGNM